jgi:signal transduction histidine kinase
VAVRILSNGVADGLEVYNDFPGGVRLPLDQLFEPFFRADPSRSSRTGGNGLGLAICRAITVANGWNLSWVQEGAGVRATVLFGAG